MRRATPIIFAIIAAITIALVVLYFQGSRRIAGEDKNGNGIWDDVEEKINAQFENPLLRKAAYQEAITFQDELLNPENAVETHKVMLKNERCFAYIVQKFAPELESKQFTIVRDLIVTNRAREKQWVRFNVKLSGEVWSLPQEDKSSCQFDTSGL